MVPTSKPKRTKRARTSYTLFYKEKMAQLRGRTKVAAKDGVES